MTVAERKRPLFKWLKRVLIVSFVLWLIFAAVLAGISHFAGRADNAQPADVIIVLGAGLRRSGAAGWALTRRAEHASVLWEQGHAPLILCSGGQSPSQQRSEAEGCRDVLLEEGIPPDAIALENRSRSTEENALYSQEIMQANRWSKAILVTDSFHALRAQFIFSARGYDTVVSPVPWQRINNSGYYITMLGREVVALHWQVFKDTLNLPITHVP
jgi:uncharacterized SAM-binding protein YcdF (DUF218 family)